MPSGKRIYLDTNILIEAVEGGAFGSQLIDLLAGNDGSIAAYLFTSELTLAEVLVHPLSQNKSGLVHAYDNILNNSAILNMCPIDQSILWHAAVLRSKYTSLKLPDAIHLSTAICTGCTHFLSADKRLVDVYRLPHSAFDNLSTQREIQVIRPDGGTLNALISEFELTKAIK